MEWVRGGTVGHGSFGTVNLAIPRSQTPHSPPSMAVKSCGVSHSASLMNEKLILDRLRDCPHIIRCFGGNFSFENGEKLYNLMLEYASGGTLADKLRNSGECGLPESNVRRYTRSIVKGLHHVHGNGFVHCDIKLQNCLLFCYGGVYVAKIADFGLAKQAGVRSEKVGFEVRGTPLYMSPEMVAGGEQEPPADIWALGCLVVELLTGKPPWRCRPEAGVGELLLRIGVGEEVPETPATLSEGGKDFVAKCFVKDPRRRWTAEMLLSHGFVAGDDDHGDVTVPLDYQFEVSSNSPRNPFDFSDCVSALSPATCSVSPWNCPESDTQFEREANLYSELSSENRLRQLVASHGPDWSDSESWIIVR